MKYAAAFVLIGLMAMMCFGVKKHIEFKIAEAVRPVAYAIRMLNEQTSQMRSEVNRIQADMDVRDAKASRFGQIVRLDPRPGSRAESPPYRTTSDQVSGTWTIDKTTPNSLPSGARPTNP